MLGDAARSFPLPVKRGEGAERREAGEGRWFLRSSPFTFGLALRSRSGCHSSPRKSGEDGIANGNAVRKTQLHGG